MTERLIPPAIDAASLPSPVSGEGPGVRADRGETSRFILDSRQVGSRKSEVGPGSSEPPRRSRLRPVFRPCPNHKSQIVNPKSSRRGFTLIELLVTVVVIALLASIMLGALNSARTTAREAKTKSLIARLHAVMMDKYMSYQTRRVPINTSGLTRTQAATQRLNALRELMRLEMPDRWSDVSATPATPTANGVATGLGGTIQTPAVTYSYNAAFYDAYQRVQTDANLTIDDLAANAAAECLYLIVMSIPDAADKFRGADVGDIDGDGLLEFHDGWDQPIRFIRWPAGYINVPGSTIYTADTLLQSDELNVAGDNFLMPDPFDPQGIDRLISASPGQRSGYALYPLIYSGGADKEYDVNVGTTSGNTYAYSNPPDPYDVDSNNNMIGQPVSHLNPSNAGEYHFDNITNHNIEAR